VGSTPASRTSLRSRRLPRRSCFDPIESPMNRVFPFCSNRSNYEALALLILCGLLVAGCHTGPSSASFASVDIPGKTPEEICKTAASVFQADGYRVAQLTPASMVFQKEASRGTSLAYGGVIDTHYGAITVIRVRGQLVDLGAGSYRLQCQAYIVRNAQDSFFEDEQCLTNVRSGPYQSLLNRVAETLK
jgi:hypothetical protein